MSAIAVIPSSLRIDATSSGRQSAATRTSVHISARQCTSEHIQSTSEGSQRTAQAQQKTGREQQKQAKSAFLK
jgi:hypothetical protein